MRILLITEFFPESAGKITGGVEARAFYVAKELAKRNTVVVLTSKRPNIAEGSFSKFRVIRINPRYPYSQTGSLVRRMLFGLNACVKGPSIVRSNNIEIVDGYSFFTYPAAIFIGLLTKAKSILTYHEVWVGNWVKNTGKKMGVLGELAERKVLLVARLLKIKIIAVSSFTKRELVKHGIDTEMIEVINNGVEAKSVRAKKFKAPTVCFVGRLTKHKRVDDLILAMNIVRKKIRNVRGVIIGDGPERARLEKLTLSLNLRCIEFTGFLPKTEDVARLRSRCNVFCSPSVVEGFGITLVEAIAAGLPFVVSDIEPFKEISQGKGGLLFKQGNVEDLAANLITLLTDRKLYAKCKEEEKQLAKCFSWGNIAKQIEAAYSK
ncbi:MAG: glycosyltransferase family 4 protein [Candidatus Woesearchaeota archaeon]